MNTLSDFVDKGFRLLEQTGFNLPDLGPAATSAPFGQAEVDPDVACTSLSNQADFSSLNSTILNSAYFPNAVQVTALGVCQPTAEIVAGVCRVHLVASTSNASAATAEAWLPTDWNKQFLAIGNLGMGGCECTSAHHSLALTFSIQCL